MSKSVSFAGAVALAAALGQADVIVDDFSMGSSVDIAPVDSLFEDLSVLGGRQIITTEVENPLNTPTIVAVSTTEDPATSGFSVNMGAGNATLVSLIYGGDDRDLDVDFPANDIQSVELNFISVDFAFEMMVSITDDNGETAQTTAVIPAGTPGTIFLPLVTFSNLGSLDLANINELQLDFNTDDRTDVDFFLSQVKFSKDVPAPGPIVIAGIGGLIAFRRRR